MPNEENSAGILARFLGKEGQKHPLLFQVPLPPKITALALLQLSLQEAHRSRTDIPQKPELEKWYDRLLEIKDLELNPDKKVNTEKNNLVQLADMWVFHKFFMNKTVLFVDLDGASNAVWQQINEPDKIPKQTPYTMQFDEIFLTHNPALIGGTP